MRIFFSLLLCLIAFASQAASFDKGIIIDEKFYPYEMIDSITYSNSSSSYIQQLWINGEAITTPLNGHNEVHHFSSSEENGIYEIEIPNSDIDKAYISSKGIILLYYFLEEKPVICLYDLNDVANKIYITFDSNDSIANIISSKYLTCLSYSESEGNSIITFGTDKLFSEDIIPVQSTHKKIRKSSFDFDSFIDNLSKINDINNYLQNNRSGEQTIWERLGDFGSYSLGELLPKIGGAVYGALVDLSLDQLNKLKEKYHDEMLKIIYGNCSVEIISIDNIDYHYSAQLKISGTNSLPKNRYNNKSLGVYYGIVGRLNNTPTYQNNDFKKGNYFTTEDLTQMVDLGQLKVASHYFVMPYIVSYNQVRYNHVSDEIRYGKQHDIQTPRPEAQAIKILENSVTQNSATLVCVFSNIGEGVTCGVEVDDENLDIKFFNASNSNGEQNVQLSGLEPATQYKCFAYTVYNGARHYCPTPIVFETNLPDVSGTWNCTQKNWNSWNQTYTETTYTITLHEDGTVTHTSSMSSLDPISSSWSYGKGGVLNISIMDIATQTQNHGLNWEFKTTTPKDPKEFEGSVYGWNFNNVIGYKQGDSSSCRLYR